MNKLEDQAPIWNDSTDVKISGALKAWTSAVVSLPTPERITVTTVTGYCWAKLTDDSDQSKIDKDEYITMTLPNSGTLLFWCEINKDEVFGSFGAIVGCDYRYVPVKVQRLPVVTL